MTSIVILYVTTLTSVKGLPLTNATEFRLTGEKETTSLPFSPLTTQTDASNMNTFLS